MTTTKRFAALFALLIIIALFPLIIVYAMLRAIPSVEKQFKRLEGWINENLLNEIEGPDMRFILISLILIFLAVALIVPQKKYYGPESDRDRDAEYCGPGQPCY